METFCVILHQVDRRTETTLEKSNLKVEKLSTLSKRLKKIDLSELSIKQVYLFKCKKNLFILYVGYLIPVTGCFLFVKE